MSEYLPCIEIEPEQQADSVIIWLHGLGADGHDFEGIVPQLRLPKSLALRYVFPNAPSIPITINNGHVMPAWFDIIEPGEIKTKVNIAQLLVSVSAVHKLIDREIERGVASDRIILAGFSQGGAVNYQAALTYDKPLAGLLSLSTFFPTSEAIEIHPANHDLLIQVFHGTQDPVLSLAMAEYSVRELQRLGLHPKFKTYPMPHTVAPEEIADISCWIQDILQA